jgi:D-amino-acid dehydrogenase
MPFIGPAPGKPGLFLATGHGRKGILLCLATGKYLAQRVAGEKAGYDLGAFRIERVAGRE